MEIVVCASNPVVRAGLTAIVTAEQTEPVVGEVESMAALSAWLDTRRADVAVIVLSTLSLFESDRILDLCESSLAHEAPSVLLLFERRNDLPAGLMHRLMATGQVSVLPLDVPAAGLMTALGAISQGFNVLHPSIAESLFDRTEPLMNELELEIEPLSAREGEVLNLVASGLANRAIAQSLSISEHTVKFHVSTILAKLNVSSRTEAVSVGIRSGIVML